VGIFFAATADKKKIEKDKKKDDRIWLY